MAGLILSSIFLLDAKMRRHYGVSDFQKHRPEYCVHFFYITIAYYIRFLKRFTSEILKEIFMNSGQQLEILISNPAAFNLDHISYWSKNFCFVVRQEICWNNYGWNFGRPLNGSNGKCFLVKKWEKRQRWNTNVGRR